MNDAPSGPASALRERSAHGHARVTYVELFFDLVFVFAITQLSHGLAHHFDLLGAAQMGVLFIAMWCAWINTGWVTNWADPEWMPTRLMLFGMMFLGLIASAKIPDAYGGTGLVFAIAYVVFQRQEVRA